LDDIKVLLVDDEREFVESLSERLDMRDVNNKVAYDGEQALVMLETEVPDVIVQDLRMPGMDGMAVLEQVVEKYPQVKVIILTGHGTDKDEDAARRVGAFDYMTKPFDIDELLDKIRAAAKAN